MIPKMALNVSLNMSNFKVGDDAWLFQLKRGWMNYLKINEDDLIVEIKPNPDHLENEKIDDFLKTSKPGSFLELLNQQSDQK